MEVLGKNKKYIGLAGCVLTIIACFVPLVSILGISANWFEGDGKMVVVLSIISAILIFFKKYIISLIPSCVNALLFIILTFEAVKSDTFGYLQFGYYLLIIGLILMIGHVFIKDNNTNNI